MPYTTPLLGDAERSRTLSPLPCQWPWILRHEWVSLWGRFWGQGGSPSYCESFGCWNIVLYIVPRICALLRPFITPHSPFDAASFTTDVLWIINVVPSLPLADGMLPWDQSGLFLLLRCACWRVSWLHTASVCWQGLRFYQQPCPCSWTSNIYILLPTYHFHLDLSQAPKSNIKCQNQQPLCSQSPPHLSECELYPSSWSSLILSPTCYFSPCHCTPPNCLLSGPTDT